MQPETSLGNSAASVNLLSPIMEMRMFENPHHVEIPLVYNETGGVYITYSMSISQCLDFCHGCRCELQFTAEISGVRSVL